MSATILSLNVEAFEIRAQGLDPIRVITHDIAPGQGRIVEAIKAAMPMSQVTDVSVQPQQPTVAETDSLEIFDERGRPLKIGMRVGGRHAKEPRSMSRRGLILEGYEPGHPEPYITNAGRFPIVQLDHQPDMEQWIADQESV